jgi:hypothetical protein
LEAKFGYRPPPKRGGTLSKTLATTTTQH